MEGSRHAEGVESMGTLGIVQLAFFFFFFFAPFTSLGTPRGHAEIWLPTCIFY